MNHGDEAMTRGVHHLALTTEDMKMTVDFYVNVLGMKLVHAMRVPAGLGTGPANRSQTATNVCQGITGRLGRRIAIGKPVKNQDLWQRLEAAVDGLGTIWLETGAGEMPSCRHTDSSICGGMPAYVPTGPEILPTDTASLVSAIDFL